jgi:hypothetical protein
MIAGSAGYARQPTSFLGEVHQAIRRNCDLLDGGDMGSRLTAGGSLVDPWAKELKTKDRPKAASLSR